MPEKIYIIAEAGVNHNGDIGLAYQLIDAASAAKADAVKFQMFRAEALVTTYAEQAAYQKRNLAASSLRKQGSHADHEIPAFAGMTLQYDMLRKLELSLKNFQTLKKYCDKKKITFLVTPFDELSADQLDPLVEQFKISSGDCTNIPLLKHIASKRKPIILSTGMTTLEEVRRAVDIFSKKQFTLLHCTTNYPCPFPEVNLGAMKTLRDEFQCPVGLSDHTEGIEVAIAAAALGASVIEKHFTLDRTLPGPDHKASLEPNELISMVRAIRNIEQALGDGVKKPQISEVETAKVARRSLVFSKNLPKGTVLHETHFLAKRPGTGLSPEKIEQIVGRTLKKAVVKDELVSFESLETNFLDIENAHPELVEG
ncbi:MAG: N-acetylneuraminate synthase [Deltaproteobacteria bacterium RIFCSPLOWO2_02_FULL_44_10]|nr:MAG: N-acetylneuraminate synthase [Deltaproteobacteria bacterium RIFCSPHIGHO2_02_FULL_44_16]OGQ45953.1 MAG: N-acetylneuraminate synthase [Deltaproteobacteria bacterium RIFCSPLOWO2_02_FULL_44_10]